MKEISVVHYVLRNMNQIIICLGSEKLVAESGQQLRNG